MVPLDLERGNVTWEETMGFLKVVEYRYTRFALDERVGRWAMVRLGLSQALMARPPTDASASAETGEIISGRRSKECRAVWMNRLACSDGFSSATTRSTSKARASSRSFLTRCVSVRLKDTDITLILRFDQVLHPFYVFQVASIVLWSLDE